MPPIDRLSALDSAFLDLDSAQAPLHVGWTILVEGDAPSLSALRRRGERPATVKVLVPVNVRGGSEAAAMGNRISFVTVSLPVAVTSTPCRAVSAPRSGRPGR